MVRRTDRAPKWIKPQLTGLVDEAPGGVGWLHEIKYDGYRLHARIDGRDIKLLPARASTGRTATAARSRRLAR
jgi:bifunctional non-homologous end joining protein LigD